MTSSSRRLTRTSTVVATTVALVAGASAQHEGGPLFPDQIVGFDALPLSIAAGDIDGDGSQDLLVTVSRDWDLRLDVLLNNGQGLLVPSARDVGVPLGERDVVLEDIDADGLPDVVAIAEDGGVLVLTNRGGGDFELTTSLPVNSGALRIMPADIEGDGDTDLLINTDGWPRALLVAENRGGILTDPVPLNQQPPGTLQLVLDYDTDGDIDVLVSGRQALLLMENTSTGQFMTPRPLGSFPHAGRFQSGDFDGDGDPDLAARVSSEKSLLLLRNNGPFVLTEFARIPMEGDGFESIAVADFDRDGRDDVAVTLLQRSRVRVLLAGEDSSFDQRMIVSGGRQPHDIVTADFDGDGAAGYATAAPFTNSVLIARGLGDGTFENRVDLPVARRGPVVDAGDLDLDGDADLLVLSFSGNQFSLLESLGGERFAPFRTLPVRDNTNRFTIGDLDRDGLPDLVATSRDPDGVVVLRNLGGLAFAEISAQPLGDSPLRIALGDFDGDGATDVATLYYPFGGLSVLLNDGTGRLLPERDLGMNGIFTHADAADLDGDGDTDLTLTDSATRDAVLLVNNGDATFQTAKRLKIGQRAAQYRTADLNGDGMPELIAPDSHPDSREVIVAINNGDLTFAPLDGVPIIDIFPVSSLADIDGDGHTDLVLGGNNSFAVLLNDGTGRLGPELRAMGSDISLATGDLDGDEDIDVAMLGAGDNARLFFNTSRSVEACEADFDGDGELTPADFAAFTDAFDAGKTRADLDGDGTLTVFDFLAFGRAFEAGCP